MTDITLRISEEDAEYITKNILPKLGVESIHDWLSNYLHEQIEDDRESEKLVSRQTRRRADYIPSVPYHSEPISPEQAQEETRRSEEAYKDYYGDGDDSNS